MGLPSGSRQHSLLPAEDMARREEDKEAASRSEDDDDAEHSSASCTEEEEDAEEAALSALHLTMKTLPFGERERLRLQGVNGVPLDKALAQKRANPNGTAVHPNKKSKHAPKEQSSKVEVTRNRLVVDVPRRQARDPRFTSEPVDMNTFRRGYKFLEDQVSQEITQMRAVMQKEQQGRALGGRKGRKMRKLADSELGELQQHLTRAEQFQSAARRAKQSHEAIKEYKKTTGKLFVPASVKKQITLNRRFADLEKRGTLDRFMLKKRKRHGNTAKEAGPTLGI